MGQTRPFKRRHNPLQQHLWNKGFTQAEIAAVSGVTQSAISMGFRSGWMPKRAKPVLAEMTGCSTAEIDLMLETFRNDVARQIREEQARERGEA